MLLPAMLNPSATRNVNADTSAALLPHVNSSVSLRILSAGPETIDTHHRLGVGDADQEDEVGDEEAYAEVQVDGGARPLDGAAELEGQDAQGQAEQRHAQPDFGDQQERHAVLRRGTTSALENFKGLSQGCMRGEHPQPSPNHLLRTNNTRRSLL